MNTKLFSELPTSVRIMEVGPRDGLQNETMALDADQRVGLIRALATAGVKNIEVGSFVSPKWVPQMADTDTVVSKTGDIDANLSVLVPNPRGMEQALVAEVKEIAVFTATSEAFCLKNTNCSVDESLERIKVVTEQALAAGMRVRGYVSTVLDCPYDGPMDAQRCADISKQLIDMGCYEVSLGDTIGKGTPIRMAHLLETVMKQVPASQLAVHCHDTYGQALANILVSLQMGISVVDSSVGGLGGCPYAKGASGNVATEDVVFMLTEMGIETGIDLSALNAIARDMSVLLDKPLPGHVHKA
jgi:hydroxymethylglutaryl-CoA lyase